MLENCNVTKEFVWGRIIHPSGKESIAVQDEKYTIWYALIREDGYYTGAACATKDTGEFDGWLDHIEYRNKGIDAAKVCRILEYLATHGRLPVVQNVSVDSLF